MRIRVKICGLTHPEDVRAAVDAGADAVGLVFARSARQVDPVQAEELLAAAHGVLKVAVFRTLEPRHLAALRGLPIDLLQAERVQATPPLPLLPALSDGPLLLDRALAAATPTPLGEVLVDGPQGGGRGVPADRGRAAAVARLVPTVLAGGLTPETVGAAIAAVRPIAVDVSSGVCAGPRRKDPARIHAFVAAVRAAEETL